MEIPLINQVFFQDCLYYDGSKDCLKRPGGFFSSMHLSGFKTNYIYIHTYIHSQNASCGQDGEVFCFSLGIVSSLENLVSMLQTGALCID